MSVFRTSCSGLWLLCLLTAGLRGQDNLPETLQFRRLYVPQERLQSGPLDPGVRYGPLHKTEFERLISLLRTSPAEGPAALAVRLDESNYQARLMPGDYLSGQAMLQVHRSSLRAVGDEDPGSLLRLDPCGLAIRHAHWPEDPAEDAVYGLEPGGKTAVLVKRSGALMFDWTLRGVKEASGAWRYNFELPACPCSSLVLELPATLSLAASRGVIVQSSAIDERLRRWRLELGGNNRFWILLQAHDEVRPDERPVLRQSDTYSITPRAVELTSQLTIDVGGEPLRQLELRVDAGLRLLAARHGDAQLSWSVLDDGSSGVSRVVLEFPEPLEGLGNVVRLGATAPIQLDQPWPLPSIRTEGLFWQEGRATLLVPKPLALERLNTRACRQSSIAPLPPPTTGESVGVQYFVPDASIEVLLAHGLQRLEASTATSIHLAEDSIQAQAAANVRVSEGQLFSLQAVVPNRWIIDSVESEPPGRIRDWSLDTPTPRRRVLDVRLTNSLSANSPLRLIVSGHRLNGGTGETASLDELRLVEIVGAAGDEHYMSVVCPETYQLSLAGAEELNRYDPDNMDPRTATLFSEPPQGLVFRVDPKAARLAVGMQRLAARYTANIEVNAVVGLGPLWEGYRIECLPQSSRVEHVLVYFSFARESPPRWRLRDAPEDQLLARRLTDEEMLAVSGRETGEMWELTLRQPRSTPFVIQAGRTTPLDEARPLSLLWLPGAESQDARLVLRSRADAALDVRNTRLKPLPITSQSGENPNVVRAVYRYSPTHDTAAADPPPIALARTGGAWASSGKVAWQASLESRYEPDGMAHHRATWLLEINGPTNLKLTLPAATELDEAWVDEQRVSARRESGQLAIALDGRNRYPVVAVHFRTSGAVLGEVQELVAPLPIAVDTPVLAADWILWLPPGYSLAGGGAGWQAADRAPLSVSKRLLGPLARPAGATRFDLFDADAWRRLAGFPQADERASNVAASLLSQMGRAAGTWGDLLHQAQAAVETPDHVLLVDRQALWKAGISPDTPLASLGASLATGRGLERLEAARLALLIHEDAAVVTTMIAAAALREQLAPLQHAAVFRVREGSVDQLLRQVVRQQGSHRFRLVSQWSAEPLTPWQMRRLASSEGVDNPGWGVFRMVGPAGQAPRAQIVRQSTLDVFAWGVFLLIVCVGFRSLKRPLWLVGMAGCSAVLALVVPEAYAIIFSTALLGFLASLVWQAIARPAPAPVQHHSSYSFKLSDSVRTVATGSLLLAWLLVVSQAMADEEAPPAEKEPPRPTVHKVFVPVDADQKPAGDHYWVPEGFYTQLQRRAARLALEPEGWLLQRAEYRGALSWDVASQRLSVTELRAALDVYVFDASAPVKLPLARDGFTMASPERILLDGMAASVQWDEQGRVLSFEVPQAGPYRLELFLRPEIKPDSDRSGFDLQIPPLASARLELQLPRTATVEVPSAMGAVETEPGVEGSRLTAQLGPTDRLSVRWRDGAAAASVRTTMDADQLVWLKVQPGSVVADARWKFKVVEGAVRQLQVALDPRLQLQAPLEGRNPLVAQSRLLAGSPQLLQIDLVRPVTDQFTLDASFRWSGATGIGNLRSPLVELQHVRTLKRMLAVSLDALLEHQETPANGWTNMTAAEFLATWGGMEAAPRLAYRVSAGGAWTLAVRPKPLERKVDSVLAVSLAAGRSDWRYDATVETTGNCFEHRLQVPPTLNIENIEVREDGVPRLAHWSRDPGGSITVFLSEAAAGPQQLTLQGWTALPQRGPWRMGSIRMEDAQQESVLVRVYRQPSLLVEVRNRNALTEQGDLRRSLENQLFEADRRYASLGRLVSLMKAEGPAYSASLLLSPNQPRFECRQVTTLRREADVWQAELECRVNVLAGLVDALRFEIPPTWQPPFVVTPAANTTVVETGNGGRQLVVRPVAALSGEATLHVRGNLVVPSSARLQMPTISLVGAEKLERLLVVPRRIDFQAVSWETRGLSPAELPPDWAVSAGLAMPQAYHVVDDAFSAVLQPATRAPGKPEVSLADIHFAWQTDGQVRGVAAFDVLPSGHLTCPLHMPPGFQLVQALVNRQPALVKEAAPQQWILTLGSDELPQRIEVLFAGILPPGTWGRERLQSPTLGDLKVERTVWTVRGPRGSELVDSLLLRRAGALQQNLWRLQSIASMMESARGEAANETLDDLIAWHQSWAARYDHCRADLQRDLSMAGEAGSSGILEQVRSLDQLVARWTAEIGAEESPPEAQLVAFEPRTFWRYSFEEAAPPIRAVFTGRATELEVFRGPRGWEDWPVRLLLSVLVIAVTAVLLSLACRGRLPSVYRWRHALGVAGGLAWWMWLYPSALGWLLAAVSLIAAWRDRKQPQRESSSGIVRLGTGGTTDSRPARG